MRVKGKIKFLPKLFYGKLHNSMQTFSTKLFLFEKLQKKPQFCATLRNLSSRNCFFSKSCEKLHYFKLQISTCIFELIGNTRNNTGIKVCIFAKNSPSQNQNFSSNSDEATFFSFPLSSNLWYTSCKWLLPVIAPIAPRYKRDLILGSPIREINERFRTLVPLE